MKSWLICIALIAFGYIFGNLCRLDIQHKNVTETPDLITSKAGTYPLPVYKLVGRKDILISRPAATAYIFERGGLCEYVVAGQVIAQTPREGQEATNYYVKFDDGNFYRLNESVETR